MTLVLVVNYGFLSSFRNVLPNSNLFVRKYTFHNTAFIVHAKAVTFEVTSLIVTSNWNEIWLALASSEKKSSHVHLGHKLTWPDPSLCNAVSQNTVVTSRVLTLLLTTLLNLFHAWFSACAFKSALHS